MAKSPRREKEMDTEMRFHMESYAEDLVRQGVTRGEATRRARVEFGGVELTKDHIRASIGVRFWEDLWADVRFALRIMRKNPEFTLIAVLSFGVGMGVNSTLFSFADAVLLRPLAVAKPADVVTILGKSPTDSARGISYRDYVDFRDRAKALTGIAAYRLNDFGFAENSTEQPQKRTGMLVSGNLFDVMGVKPMLGRGFRADEDQVPGRDPVVVLSYDFWTGALRADPSAIGRHVRLNGIAFTVIGVAPAAFTGLDQYFRPEMYVPLAMLQELSGSAQADELEKRDQRGLQVKGRLAPGATIETTQAELQTLAAGLAKAYPETNRDQSVIVVTEFRARTISDPPDAALVALLMSLAGLVLMVACANLANLLLGRARARTHEIATRIAIGAGRLRLIRQLLTESVVIAVAGAGVGLVLAMAGTAFLRTIRIPSDIPIVIAPQLDERVLVFSLAVSLVSALLFGLVPAVQATRADIVDSLKPGGAGTSGKTRTWGRNALVMTQVALSLVLMVVAAMMYRGFQGKFAAGPGFRTDHLATMTFDPSVMRYTDAQTKQFYKQLVDRARALPDLKSVSVTGAIPMSPTQSVMNVVPEGYQLPKDLTSMAVFTGTVGTDYFATIGIPIVRGRGFLETDTDKAPLVAVVNEVFARDYWPNQDAIGKRFRFNDTKSPAIEVVGIAKTAKYLWIGEADLEFVYVPFAQNPRSRMTLLAQTQGDPGSALAELRETVHGVDANQPVVEAQTMGDFFRMRSVNVVNMLNEIVGGMGVIGLLLALVGLYGLISYSVTRRAREIAIRMAIGADSLSVVKMVLRQGLVTVSVGLGIGLAISFFAEQAVQATISSTKRDPIAYLIVAPAILVVAMLAAWLPARRASRVSPLSALRSE
jgi:predicted permease